MDIFNLLTMIGGLALFLYGMKVMGDALVQLSGGKLEKLLEKLTSRRITAVLLGTLVTAVIQSSSATTVMVVGFVNSGIMKLSQAVGVIMGANIGTTVTSWILSLAGLNSSNLFIKLLKPSSFSPILALIGIIFLMTEKNGSKKHTIGTILLGFAVLMFGMETMSSAVAPLKENEAFTGMLTAFSHPILGMIAGAVLTAIIQSSSASVGILQALCLTGAVAYGTAIPIIMGQNIGTCVTALLSSVGSSKNARRAAFIHLYFNLIGTILFMVCFYGINTFRPFAFLSVPATAAGIAVIHSLFNIGCTIVMFPFADQLVRLAELTVRDKEEDGSMKESFPAALAALDERFLDQPAFAIRLCKNAADEMADLSRKAFQLGMECLAEYVEEKAQAVIRMEQEADLYEDVLGSYLVKLSGRDLSDDDSRLLSELLHSTSDFERISDHAINIVESAQQLRERGLSLTAAGQDELAAYGHSVSDILDLMVAVFQSQDIELAKGIEPLEEVVDSLSEEMKQRHILRLRKGNCSMEAGLILEDIITNYERVSDHCSNVAVCLICLNMGKDAQGDSYAAEAARDELGAHAYLDLTVKGSDSQFREEYARLLKLYPLP